MADPVDIDGVSYSMVADDGAGIKIPRINAIIYALVAKLNIGAAWQSWIPTLTNAVIGTGGSAALVAKYARIGKMVFFRLHIVLGSGGGFGISGAVSFTLPVPRAAYGGSAFKTVIGTARLFDTSVPANFSGEVLNKSTTEGYITVSDSSATYLKPADLSSTVPFIWAAGDEINVQGFYEAA